MTEISLRDVRTEDLPVLYEHQADPVAHEMADFKPRSREEFMAHWTKILADPTLVACAILFESELAGHVCAFDRDGKREVGYWIAREHWGKGIASEALSRFLAMIPERPLYAGVASRNVASLRVLAKCGFTIDERDADRVTLVLGEAP